jgi:DNA-binding helix-turn-helix protein
MTMSEYHKNVYANIELARNQKGLSKGELANEIGISKSGLSFVLNRLKNGKTINTKTLEKWANALNVPFSFFFEIKRN